MIMNKIEQKSLINIENYNDFWEKEVSGVIESVYQNADHFVSSYSFNPKKTLGIIMSNMKAIPIDIKETLDAFFIRLSSDDNGDIPPRAIAG